MGEDNPSRLKLSEAQQEAFEQGVVALHSKTNLFLTGPGGSGKSYLMQLLVGHFTDQFRGRRTSVTLPPDAPIASAEAVSLGESGREHALLILDGLDQVPIEGKGRDAVIRLIQQTTSHGGLVIATSRNLPSQLLDAIGLNARVLELSSPSISRDHIETPTTIDIYVDPGSASVETLQGFFDALSDLHVAAGGLGLEYKTDGNSVFALSETEQ